MDPTTIAAAATDLSTSRLQQTQELTVLKKAIDLQAEGALQLIEALPPLPTLSTSGGVAGQIINVKA